MVAQLIWIAAVYASAVASIHFLHHREQTRKMFAGKWLHYIFITRNHESVVEGYIRALAVHSFLTGRRLRVTFMDEGSDDATAGILSRLAHNGCSVELQACRLAVHTGEELKQQGYVVDLRMSGEYGQLPFLRTAGSRGYGSKRGGL
ncbi:hypothetical protein GCM10010912_36010 [Paenibacillus albidus]|uniref:Uncharacterized protein n=1 Tax=Paenibacillus albidus TaxID=2041023 RepID=A0A917CIE3_9BACL|nr:hypothetical protein [Paenibacillus albidus]GGF87518.1 hypothetical protein GCM10010912_36010 [Paenibacillus albidus]